MLNLVKDFRSSNQSHHFINHIIISTLWKQKRLQLPDLPVVDWSVGNNNAAYHHKETDYNSRKHRSRKEGATWNGK